MDPSLPHLDGARHRMVDTGSVRLHLAEAGEGEPLLLVMGWPQHWYAWRHLIAPLAMNHRVICVDLRGLGWSEAPPSGYDKQTFASDLLGLLDALGIERTAYVGHDWGAWTGILLGLRAPERVSRMVLFNIAHPWAPVDWRAIWAMRCFWYQWTIALPVVGARLVRSRRLVEHLIRHWSASGTGVEEIDPRIYSERLTDPDRARASSLIYRTFVTRELPRIAIGRYASGRLAVPTRFVCGAEDGAIRPDLLRGLSRGCDDFELEIVPGVGHFIPEEAPDLALDRIRGFLMTPGSP